MIALSFDTDWMQPADLERFLDENPFPGAGTFFVHRPFALAGLQGHELCPHPPPVAPDDWTSSIARMLHDLGLAPTGVRTHSALHSHRLELAMFELGFRYTSNTSRLFLDGTLPVRLAWGCWELPIYYMDNLDLTMAKYWPELCHQPLETGVLQSALAGDGLYVFDFHPLHVCLNTPTLEYYLDCQPQVRAGTSPYKLRYPGRGVGSFFREFCGLLRTHEVSSVRLNDALERFLAGNTAVSTLAA
jgi:hypothetical protein